MFGESHLSRLSVTRKSFQEKETAKAKNFLLLRLRERLQLKLTSGNQSSMLSSNLSLSLASPNMKDVYKNGTGGKPIPKRLLQTTLQRAYLMFKQDYPQYPFRYTVFRRSKARHGSSVASRTAVPVCSVNMLTSNSS